jgi:FKBP-type peptidyl-prolyl cis-trans isomerase
MADGNHQHRHGVLLFGNHGENNNHRDQSTNNDRNSKQGAGILLRTLQKGSGNKSCGPRVGDSCLIHYEGFLEDGMTRILGCSSRVTCQPLLFEVGAQQVMEGIDVAVQHMTEGQHAEVTIPHRYAYGASGYPPQIPPKATLVFRIELLEIQEQKAAAAAAAVATAKQQRRRWLLSW